MRIHARHRDALWFGPPPGSPPVHRFDDPLAQFRMCYLGTTVEVCFAETFLRNPPIRIVAEGDLASRLLTTIEVQRELRLVALYGPNLARLGTTAELASGSDYDSSQTWSRAFWEHPGHPDGIAYRPRHDDSALGLAVYDRAKNNLAVVGKCSLSEDPQLLTRLLRRYDLGLTR